MIHVCMTNPDDPVPPEFVDALLLLAEACELHVDPEEKHGQPTTERRDHR